MPKACFQHDAPGGGSRGQDLHLWTPTPNPAPQGEGNPRGISLCRLTTLHRAIVHDCRDFEQFQLLLGYRN